MSLILPITSPDDQLSKLTIGTYGYNEEITKKIYFGKDEMTMEDFLQMVEYVLTNTDLIIKNDLRIKFLRRIKKSRYIKGYNPGGKRIQIP